MNRRSNQKGFTLIEIAIVLIIIGILLGLGVALIGPLTKQAQFKRSRERVRACKEAIIGFVAARGRLPSSGEFHGICNENDAWGNTLGYIVDDSSKDNGVGTNVDLTQAGKVCCSQVPADVGLVDNSSGTTKERKDIAFIVYSKGENRSDEISKTEASYTIDSTTYLTYFIQEYSDSFDDIVEYATIYELRDTIRCEPLQIVSTSLPQATEDYTYSAKIRARGSCLDNITFSLSSGALPNGLSLSSDGTITGTVNECTTCPSGSLQNCYTSQTFTVQVRNNITGTTDNETFTIQTVPQPLTILTSSLPDAYIGTSYNATVQATGGRNPGSYSPGFTFSGLPGGLTGASNGTISGTPSTTASCGTYSVVVQDNDSCTTTTKTLSLYLNKPRVSCSLTATDNGDNTSTLTYTVFNGYGQADGTFSPSTGTCTGFTNHDNGTCTTGTILSETTIQLTVTDHCGYVNTCQTTVRPSGTGGGGGGCSTSMSLSPASGTTFNATVGNFFSQTITVSGGQGPYTNTQCTNNCSTYGLNLSCSTVGAIISGTPTSAGTCTFTVAWQDSCSPPNSVTGTYTVNISGGGGGGDACTGSHGDTSCDPGNPPVAGTNGTPGDTYPAWNIHLDNKNLYLSILCETGTCGGHTFDKFTLTCGGGCGALGTNFKGIHYSIEDPIGSGTWIASDKKAHKCGGPGCPLPINTPTTLNDKDAPIKLSPGQRLAVELKFKDPVNTGTYTLTLTFYEQNTGIPFVYQFTITVP